MKDKRNYHETETENYKEKLSFYKNKIKIAMITEIALPSIATTATTTNSVAITGRGIPHSIQTAFAVSIEQG